MLIIFSLKYIVYIVTLHKCHWMWRIIASKTFTISFGHPRWTSKAAWIHFVLSGM